MTDYSRYSCLRVAVGDDKIAIVTLDRPEHLNAADPQLHREIQELWIDIARDPDVQVIVLTGAGKAFCAGGDVKALAARAAGDDSVDFALRSPLQTVRLVEQMLLVPQPIIAAVNGDATGFGLTLALLCDMCLIADHARLGDPHVKVGLVAGDGSAVLWPLLVGPQRAKEYLMTGRLFSAAEAKEMGIGNHVLPAEQIVPEALALARELASNPLWAVQWTKASINKALKVQLQQALEMSIAYESLSMLTHDHREATEAFVERRPPDFIGS